MTCAAVNAFRRGPVRDARNDTPEIVIPNDLPPVANADARYLRQPLDRTVRLETNATSEGADLGLIGPLDFGYDFTQSATNSTWTVSLPGINWGVGGDYTRMTSTGQGRTFWSKEHGWGWQ
jgi:hypothetical protein